MSISLSTKWIREDISKSNKLNVSIHSNNDEKLCWLYMYNNEYYITDTDSKLNAQLEDNLEPSIENNYCVKISIQSYLYTSLVRIKEGKTNPYLLIFITEYIVLSKQKHKINDIFDIKSLKPCKHRTIDRMEISINNPDSSSSPDDEIKNHSVANNSINNHKKANQINNIKAKSYQDTICDSIEDSNCSGSGQLTDLVNNMTTIDCTDLTIEIHEKEKLIDDKNKCKQNIDDAFYTQSDTLNLFNNNKQNTNTQQNTLMSEFNSTTAANNTNNLNLNNLYSSTQIDKNDFNVLINNIDQIMSDKEQTGLSGSISLLQNSLNEPQVSTQIDSSINTRSGRYTNHNNDLNVRFKPISPIQETSIVNSSTTKSSSSIVITKKTNQTTTQQFNDINIESTNKESNSNNDDIDDEDDESIDGIWIEKNKVIEETKQQIDDNIKQTQLNGNNKPTNDTQNQQSTPPQQQQQPQNQIENDLFISKNRVTRLLSTNSTHSSEYSFVSNSSAKKRKKLFQLNEHNHLLDSNKKSSDLITSSSSGSSTSISSCNSFDGDNDDDEICDDVNSVNGLSNTSASCVFELCSQSIIFAPKNSRVIREKLIKKAFSERKERNKKQASNLFAPLSSNNSNRSSRSASVSSQSGATASTKNKDYYTTTELLRTNNCKLNDIYLTSPSANPSSKLIDNIIIDNEQKKLNKDNEDKKKGRKRLFDHSSYDYVESAFNDEIEKKASGDKNSKLNDKNNKSENSLLSVIKINEKKLLKETSNHHHSQSQKAATTAATTTTAAVGANQSTISSNNQTNTSSHNNSSESSIPLAQKPKDMLVITNSNNASKSSSLQSNNSELQVIDEDRILKTSISNFNSNFLQPDVLQDYLNNS